MKKIKVLIYLLALLTFTGCGRKGVDYDVDDISDNSSGHSDISLETIGNKIGVEGKWEETIDAEKGKKINAKVIVPDVRGMKIIDVEKTDYVNNPQKKEEFIANITTEPVYYYDYERVPKEILADELEDMRQRIEMYEANGYPVDNWYESYEYELERFYNAPEDYVPVEEYDTYEYLISYNDMNYTIEFNNYGDGKGDNIYMELQDSNQVFGQVDEDTYISVREDSYFLEDNRCSMSSDEAYKKAKEFVDNLDVGEFDNVCTNYIKCYSYEDDLEEMYYNGYVFHFTRTIDGISVDGNMYTNNENIYNEAVDTAEANGLVLDDNLSLVQYEHGMEEIVIWINDKGILSMNYRSPSQLNEELSDNAVLLSFDNVKKAFSFRIDEKDYYDYTCFMYMELTYFTYYYEAEKIVILPVWRLTDEDTESMFLSSDAQCIIINAVDGTVMDVGSQIYDTKPLTY